MDISYLSGVFASPWDIVRSIIDIAIVSYVIYRLLGLIKGSRAEQLLKGLILLLAFTVAASYFKLTMVNWLVEKLWIMFAIILPIVFQPELRRFLEQLGQGRFFSPRNNNENDYESYIQEIANAADALSSHRVGALMVIPRGTGIGEYLESGTRLDAHVSSSLLQNLFFPNSPLHDGAVIVQKGRVELAGCFLPLSKNPNLNRELGTRHRAAIGISEVSDALVVVVSEETGLISLVSEGQIRRGFSGRMLKEILSRELNQAEGSTAGSWIRRWTGDGRQVKGKE